MTFHGTQALDEAARIGTSAQDARAIRARNLGLPASDGIENNGITTFARAGSPSYAGIATFLRSPYLEDALRVGEYDVAFLGAPFDAGTTYRPGTRFGPEAMRQISKLYRTFHFEAGIDLAESVRMCDLGDVYSIHNLEKQTQQLAKAVGHVRSAGTLPVVLGGDHSIALGTITGIAEATDGNIGIIQLDRHLDMQSLEMDEQMHDTPLFHAGKLPNVNPRNIVHVGIGGWQNDVRGAVHAKENGQTVLTMDDVEELGVSRIVEIALDKAWAGGVKAVYLTVDIDCVDSCFSMGTGWPEPGGFLPREILKLVKGLATPGLAGLEVVEISPPYDHNEQTALLGTRIICDALSAMVAGGTLGRR